MAQALKRLMRASGDTADEELGAGRRVLTASSYRTAQSERSSDQGRRRLVWNDNSRVVTRLLSDRQE